MIVRYLQTHHCKIILPELLLRGAALVAALLFISTPAEGWYDDTHIAIAKAAGFDKSCYAASPDIARIKAGRVEDYNHFFNNISNSAVTAEMVLKQAEQYNDPDDKNGHLYGAIIASLRAYRDNPAQHVAKYHLAFFAHYAGDVSQPLHNVSYDDFNKRHHLENDGIIEGEAGDNIKVIQDHMYQVTIRPEHFEEDVASAVAKIANSARELANTLRQENRDMTRTEAYQQLGHSASVIKAVLDHNGSVMKK